MKKSVWKAIRRLSLEEARHFLEMVIHYEQLTPEQQERFERFTQGATEQHRPAVKK